METAPAGTSRHLVAGSMLGRKHTQVLGFLASSLRKEVGLPDSGFGGEFENCLVLLSHYFLPMATLVSPDMGFIPS